MAKSTGVPLLLVGHVTKDGDLAGPRAVEHLVDTVLSFDGDRHHALRVLTSVKHRFGPAGEVGIFEMRDDGLRAVPDPGPLLLGDRMAGVPGSVVVPVLQGRRPLLVEVQALLGPGAGGGSGPPRPQTLGIDAARANLLAGRPGLPHRGRGPGRGADVRRRRGRHHRHRAGGRPGRRPGHGLGHHRHGPAARPRRLRGAGPGRRGAHRPGRGPPPGRGAPGRVHPGAGARLHGGRTRRGAARAGGARGAHAGRGPEPGPIGGRRRGAGRVRCPGGRRCRRQPASERRAGDDRAGHQAPRGPRPDSAGQARRADPRRRRPGRPVRLHRRVPARCRVHAPAPVRAGQDGRRHHPGRRRLAHRPGQRAPRPQGHHPHLGDRHPPPHGRAGGPLHRRAGDRRLRGDGDHRRLPQRPQAHDAVGRLAHRPLEPGALHPAALPRPATTTPCPR